MASISFFKIPHWAFFIGLCSLVACQPNSEPSPQPEPTSNNSLLSTDNSAKDTSNSENGKKTGHCFQLHTPDIQEFMMLTEVSTGLWDIEGETYLPKTDQKFVLTAQARPNGEKRYLVKISWRNTDNGQTINKEEIWLEQDKNFIVEQRKLADISATKLTHYQINCPNSTQKDPTLYDGIHSSEDGYAVVQLHGKYGLINSAQQIVIPIVHHSLGNIHEGTLVFTTSDLLYGVMDITGKILVPAQYARASSFSDGLAAVLPAKENALWGFVDKTGKMVIEPKFNQLNFFEGLDHIQPFTNGLANVAVDGRWGFIDKTGKTVIPFQYIHADAFDKNGEARVHKDDKWFYINKKGDCVKGCK